MTVLRIEGRDYAAGLRWRSGRSGLHQVIWDSRRSGRPYYVRREGQTGYATAEPEHETCPSLAAALADVIRADQWVALVEADDGRFAVAACRYNEIIGDEDRVFERREVAAGAVEAARRDGFEVWAVEGLVPSSRPLKWGEVAAGAALMQPLKAAPLTRLERRHAMFAATAAAMVLGVVAGWTYQDDLRKLVFGAPPPKHEAKVIPRVRAVVESETFIEGCRAALRRSPPGMPAWSLEALACHAELQDAEVIAAAPRLKGRPVLFARWRLDSTTLAAAHRRLASARLASWYVGGVSGETAWAVLELPAVLRRWDRGAEQRPGIPELRRNLDRAFGLVARIEYVRNKDGEAYKIISAEELPEIGARAAGVPGLEVRRLVRRVDGGWHLEGHAVQPKIFLEPDLQALQRPLAAQTETKG